MGEAQQEEKKAEAPQADAPQPEAKAEEKKEEKAEEKKEEEQKPEEKKEDEKKEEEKPPAPVVLFVDMHCIGCAKKVERTLLKVRGVEDVKIDMVANQVTVKGMVDPQALCTRIQRKTKRRASVISPIIPTKEGEDAKSEVVNAQASGISTVVLNVNMHCEACALQLQKKILQMRGVQTAETDLASSKVTVTGTMDANKLVEYVYRRTRKQANIVPPPKTEEEKKEEPAEEAPKAEEKKEEKAEAEEKKEEEKKEEEKKEEEGKKEEESKGEEESKLQVLQEEDAMKKMVFYPPIYVIERVYAPQIFSDENPNACCIS
ncbi:hypothetical protein EJ110_NYTH18912 [Nymphaea thermarum]|nr:hypothetical protein EJ110_NYTH18912 [Nymphaea thermarum]